MHPTNLPNVNKYESSTLHNIFILFRQTKSETADSSAGRTELHKKLLRACFSRAESPSVHMD
jgi:hypothetical protein